MLRALVFCWIALVSFAALAEEGGAEPEGMVLLTVGGFVGKTNRPPFDANRDSALAKLKVAFKSAYAFDREMLLALPQGTVRATTTELGSEAVFKGPFLQDVLVAIEAAKVKTRFVASDGKPLGLNGQGPLWLMNTRKEGETVGKDNRGSHVWGLVYMHIGE